jgi:hypothetical protein
MTDKTKFIVFEPRRWYPWTLLEIGDSFFVHDRSQNQMCSMACNATVRTSLKFTTRVAIENGIRGIRIFRTE